MRVRRHTCEKKDCWTVKDSYKSFVFRAFLGRKRAARQPRPEAYGLRATKIGGETLLFTEILKADYY